MPRPLWPAHLSRSLADEKADLPGRGGQAPECRGGERRSAQPGSAVGSAGGLPATSADVSKLSGQTQLTSLICEVKRGSLQ